MDVLLLQNHVIFIFVMTVVGNLVTQAVAAEKMLGFLNLPIGVYTHPLYPTPPHPL